MQTYRRESVNAAVNVSLNVPLCSLITGSSVWRKLTSHLVVFTVILSGPNGRVQFCSCSRSLQCLCEWVIFRLASCSTADINECASSSDVKATFAHFPAVSVHATRVDALCFYDGTAVVLEDAADGRLLFCAFDLRNKV